VRRRYAISLIKLAIAGALGLALAGLLAGCGHAYKGATFDPPRKAGDIALTDHNGQPWRLSDQRGKLVVLYFGFASCPDVCPRSLSTLAAAKRKLGADGSRIQGVLVTLDPDRDTAGVLKHYVAAFDTTFVGLRGEESELEPIKRTFSVTSSRRDLPGNAQGYTIDHSSYFYAVDEGGCYRAMFRGSMPVDDLAGDLGALASEGQSRSCR
jgi:protein SCO1